MNAEIIAVGTELLLGHIVNTNACYLSRKLASLGINVYHHNTVGDNPGRLYAALELALLRSDIIFTTGGLGPTVDDITMKVISDVCSRKMIFKKNILKGITVYFKKKGLKATPQDARKQAFIPERALWFKNNVGAAPGVVVDRRGSTIIALPGPPRELEPMFEQKVIPYLQRKGCSSRGIIKTRTIKTIGLVESRVNNKVKDLLKIAGETTVGIYAHLGGVDLKITTKAKNRNTMDKNLAKIEKTIKRRLTEYIYGLDSDTLESVVGRLLVNKGKTLSIAESCTGGLVGDRITNVSGSSRYFKMGVIAYSHIAKQSVLGVSKERLKRFGAVSKETAYEMAKGAQRLSGSDVALGITGVAGPKGGTKTKPVGLVFMSVVKGTRKKTKEYRFTGNRQEIKWQTSCAALDLVRRILI